jgi:hypothetical protein
MKKSEKTESECEEISLKFLTTNAVAGKWGLSKWTIYRLVKQGRLKPVTGLSKGWLFTGNEINSIELTRI